MDLAAYLADFAITSAIALLWARWSKLELGLSRPAFGAAEPWVLVYVLWSTAEWAAAIFFPIEMDPDWLSEMERLSLSEDLIVSVLLAPVAEELLFRGAMFAALLRRWGIWAAALIPSVIWGLMHIQYDWWRVLSLTVTGVLLAMVRWRSGSLYLPVGLHAGWNLLATLDYHGLLGTQA